jgi:hypothetical protein
MMISGKPKEQCVQALRAAFGNPDRAFEYLLGGMQAEGGASHGSEDLGEDDYGDEEGSANIGGGAGGNPFAALASNPNFALIRQRILQDPTFYQSFMQ